MNKSGWEKFLQTRTDRCRVLVVGDVMLDKYYYGEVNKFSSDAPIPVAHIINRKSTLGGAANIANNLALLGCQTSIAGFVGADHNFETLSRKLNESGIDRSGLITTDTPTTTKVRIMSGHHQMFRMDFEDISPNVDDHLEELRRYIHARLNDSLDAIVIGDYEKGVCTERFCQSVIKDANSHGVPTIIMPYGQQWIKYAHADYITPNVAKINKILLAPIKSTDAEAVERACHYIMRKFKIKNVLATRSGDGITFVNEEQVEHIKTKSQEVFDSAGAADTVAAVFAMAMAGGLNPVDGAFIANLAAGIVVMKAGSYAVTRHDMINAINSSAA